MRALILNTSTKTVAVETTPDPKPGPKEILVRVRAVALNHVDYMNTVKPLATQDKRVVGSDFAGEVAQVGKDLDGIDDPRVKIGARVAGFLQGANSVNERPGAFAEYLVVDFDLTWLVPDGISFERAASVSLCGVTAAQAVFYRLHLPSPFWESGVLDSQAGPITVFIYGASSSVGFYAAQLVKLAGKASGKEIRLIGAASASKHALLKEPPYSYDVLVDYRDPQWQETVRKAAGGDGVQYAIDAISQGDTVYNTDSVVQAGGKLAIFRAPAAGGFDMAKIKTRTVFGAVWEALGVDVQYHGGIVIPANEKARASAAAFYKFLSVSAGPNQAVLEPNPIRIMPGGLENIPIDGFALFGAGSKAYTDHRRPVSGEKIVFTVG
ncbi:GroES-like protein [Aaosphaeria arxii CBS 175.79]|uniref:GroES-like protein n=1 Tax=Aaosphaeria arxii CBS 175.79 TaxID=1450172 RepID=A0A6A5XNL9_9PLEO|nr:GroES-like protein [Aaosphaeria arxii CBS 175.79]KAF2014361.1 GroES-like protein [Aaosphaeria arxii CBS 175.79]